MELVRPGVCINSSQVRKCAYAMCFALRSALEE